MKGQELINQVCSGTDLPETLLHSELKSLLDKKDLNHDTLTLEQLRQVLAEYLQEILVKAKDDLATG